MAQDESSTAAAGPSVVTKAYKPYFTDAELAALTDRQRGKLSLARVERGRQTACTFIEAVCERVGFPRRTTATSQMLYHRFHLYFPLKDFSHIEVSLACIYVSSKLHDTLKKPRDLILHSYAVRYPQLLAGRLNVDPQTVDQKKLEHEKRKVASLERLILETICFNLGVGKPDVAALGVKISRALGLSKEFIQRSWRMTADVYRTLAPLQQTPSALILGSIYATALLGIPFAPSSKFQDNNMITGTGETSAPVAEMKAVRAYLARSGNWAEDFASSAEEVDSVAHHVLDMHIVLLNVPLADPSLSTSFSPDFPIDGPLPGISGGGAGSVPTGSKTGNGTKSANLQTAFVLSPYWTSYTLTQLKISLREARSNITVFDSSAVRGKGKTVESLTDGLERGKEISAGRNAAEVWGALSEGLGKNDATIRFLFQ